MNPLLAILLATVAATADDASSLLERQAQSTRLPGTLLLARTDAAAVEALRTALRAAAPKASPDPQPTPAAPSAGPPASEPSPPAGPKPKAPPQVPRIESPPTEAPDAPMPSERSKTATGPSPAERGYLGAVADDREDRGRGVRIVRVHPDTAAAKAGLKTGDLITGLGDVRVRQLTDFASTLEQVAPGDRLMFEVLRGRTRLQLEVTFTVRPATSQRPTQPPSVLREPATPLALDQPEPEPVPPPAETDAADASPTKPPLASPAAARPAGVPGKNDDPASRNNEPPRTEPTRESLERRIEALEQRVEQLERLLKKPSSY